MKNIALTLGFLLTLALPSHALPTLTPTVTHSVTVNGSEVLQGPDTNLFSANSGLLGKTAVATNQLDPNYFAVSVVFGPNTNGIVASGFGSAALNGAAWWSPNQPYIDDGGTLGIGCLTNSTGGYWMWSNWGGYWLANTATNNFTTQPLYDGQATITGDWVPVAGATAGTVSFALLTTNGVLDIQVAAANTLVAGAVSTNALNVVSPAVSARQNLKGTKAPMIYIGIGADGATGGHATGQDVTNIVNYIGGTPGLNNLFDGIDVDDTWYSNGDGGAWITNSGASAYCHNAGLLFCLWVDMSQRASGIGNVEPYPTNFYHFFDRTIGVADEYKLDNSWGEYEFQFNEADRLKNYVDSAAFNAGRNVMFSAKVDDVVDNFALAFNPWGWSRYTAWDSEEMSASDDIWTDFCAYYSQRAAQMNLFGDGNLPFRTLLGHLGNTNELRGALSMLAVGPMRFFSCVTNYSAAELVCLTNQNFISVLKDQAGLTGWMVSANPVDGSKVFARHLYNGSVAVAFWNPRGSNATFSVSTSRLGIPTNQIVNLQSCWWMTNLITSQTITGALKTNGADLFIVSPVSPIGAGATTNVVTGGVTLHFVGGIFTGAY